MNKIWTPNFDILEHDIEKRCILKINNLQAEELCGQHFLNKYLCTFVIQNFKAKQN